ncbi:MAG: glutamate--cysteine ligase [Caedimonas sp.]|nr:glutamate--cysteine ligase [Caedimonas sp.]
MEENFPVTSKDDLIKDLMQGCRPVAAFRIGVEHEKFIFDQITLKRASYEEGIRKILYGLQDFGWRPIFEDDVLIALQKGSASVSLEPAGQLELSGSPLRSLHETAKELHDHLKEVKRIIEPLGFIATGLGCDPVSKRDELPWMPKDRYRIMRAYMPEKGKHGLDMMTSTCTVQVNLDFSSEQDMVRKFRLGLALQPVATALFANSSLSQGQPNGFECFRRFIWAHTDPDRCGLLNFVFEESMGFERYIDYMLDVPMYFVYRKGKYIDAAGQSFKDFLRGSLPAYPGHLATLQDWHDHLTVAFPEVRLKRYLEMRGADAGSEAHVNALPAFWTGLLYDEQSLNAACDLVSEWTVEDLQMLYQKVAKEGLATSLRGQSFQEIARVCLSLAREGLDRRALKNQSGQDESIYLAYVEDIIRSGKTAAQKLLEDYHASGGDMRQVLSSRQF